MDASANYPLQLPSQFEPYDLVKDPNFDQFIDLVRGETEDVVSGLGYDLINGCFVDKQTGALPGDALELDGTSPMVLYPNYGINALSSFDGDEDDDDEEDNSSRTTLTPPMATKKAKVDRSRTLVSERRRRDRMKEKLYELRSLVPNITKMDKASIIGDAVLYVQDLQMKAKKLKDEIADLEASITGSEKYQEEPIHNPLEIRVARNNHPICKKIFKLDVFEVEEKEFYIRLVCNKSEGVALSLYKALESLTKLKVQNSNLVTVSDRFALTFTLNVLKQVGDCEVSMNLPNLKLWVSGALMNQGFDLSL